MHSSRRLRSAKEQNDTPGRRKEIAIRYRDIDVGGAFVEEAEKIAEQRQKQTA